MEKQFTHCPACGVLGEVGKKCIFCSADIVLKDGGVSFSELVPHKRSVSHQQYVDKISTYQKVTAIGGSGRLMEVSIGEQYGLININGDIVYPLGNDEISVESFDTIGLGHRYEATEIAASTSWDENSKHWEHREALKFTKFWCLRYFNLYTGAYADTLGFVQDKTNPSKLYRVDVANGWRPINTYITLEGEVHSYDYAERVELHNAARAASRKMYLLHRSDECSLWIFYDDCLDRDCFGKAGISDTAREAALNAEPTYPICVLEGIQSQYSVVVNDRVVQIIVRTLSGRDVPITLAKKKRGETRWTKHNFEQVYKEWCRAKRKHDQEIVLEELEKRGDELKVLVADADLDQNLLAKVEGFVSKVKSSPKYKKDCLSLDVTINGDAKAMRVVYLSGSKDNPSGIHLQMCPDIMSKEEVAIFDECDLKPYFYGENIVYLYLYDDAALICRVIYYLTVNVFGVSPTNVKISERECSKELENDKNGGSFENFMKVFVWGVFILLAAVAIFLFVSAFSLGNFKFFIAGIVAVACCIWCLKGFSAFNKK